MLHKNTKINIFFVRHGEAGHNLNTDLLAGRSEFEELSERGKLQSKKLGTKIKDMGIKIDKVFTSSLVRTKQTSDTLMKEAGLPVHILTEVDDLIEFSQGEWEGKPRKEIYTPENLNYINTRGGLFIPPKGESQRMVERRASNWLEDAILYNKDFLNSSEPVNILIVSHGIVIKCIFHYILGFNDRLTYRINLENCSLSSLTYKKEGWFVNYINDSTHLAEVGKIGSIYN